MIPPPLHGGQLRQLAARFNIPAEEVLDLSANLNPEGPPATLVYALRQSLEDRTLLSTYPDLEEQALKQSLARFAASTAGTISVANGFVPLLDAALRAFSVRHCLLPVPAFVEYRRTLERNGVRVTPQALSQSEDFRYDPETLLRGSHDAILLANPQNPPGILTAIATLRHLIQAAAARKITILLDEAFIDYAPEQSLGPEATDHPNLVVFRSVTKFLGVPGLRVAYAVAHPQQTRDLNAQLPPWPITTIAAKAVIAGLADEAFANSSRILNQRRNRQLARALNDLGIFTYPSPANFLLLRLPGITDATHLWERLITEHRIVLRNCANYEALAPNHLRTAVRTEAETQRLIAALRASL